MPEGDTIHHAAKRVGAALVDHEIESIAGIGNIWRSEACFLGGLYPWRPTGRAADAEVLRAVGAARPLMRRSAECGGRIVTFDRGRGGTWVYKRSGLPCRRCHTLVRSRGQGDDNRTAYWCPACQA